MKQTKFATGNTIKCSLWEYVKRNEKSTYLVIYICSSFQICIDESKINNKEFRNMNVRSKYDMKIFIEYVILLSYKIDQRQYANIIDVLLMFTG